MFHCGVAQSSGLSLLLKMWTEWVKSPGFQKEWLGPTHYCAQQRLDVFKCEGSFTNAGSLNTVRLLLVLFQALGGSDLFLCTWCCIWPILPVPVYEQWLSHWYETVTVVLSPVAQIRLSIRLLPLDRCRVTGPAVQAACITLVPHSSSLEWRSIDAPSSSAPDCFRVTSLALVVLILRVFWIALFLTHHLEPVCHMRIYQGPYNIASRIMLALKRPHHDKVAGPGGENQIYLPFLLHKTVFLLLI